VIGRALIAAGALTFSAASASAQATPNDPPNSVALDNEYVHVARDTAPCADAATPGCEDRVIVAYGPIELSSGKKDRRLAKGQVAVFQKDES
jgi:hypothetical protein